MTTFPHLCHGGNRAVISPAVAGPLVLSRLAVHPDCEAKDGPRLPVDEDARIAAAYAEALPIVRSCFDRLAAETTGAAAAGMRALLALQDRDRPTRAAALRLQVFGRYSYTMETLVQAKAPLDRRSAQGSDIRPSVRS